MTDLVMQAVIDHVHDGDTPVCSEIVLPQGAFRITAVRQATGTSGGIRIALADQRIRVAEINAPELSTPEGQAAAAFAQTLAHHGDVVTLTSPGPAGTRDNYGRILARVRLPDGRDWGQVMVAAGHARPFMVYGPHATVADGYAARGVR